MRAHSANDIPGTELGAVRDMVTAAVASLDSEQIDSVAAQIRGLSTKLNAGTPSGAERDALLAWCVETKALVNSAADFYLGVASVMQVHLYGYGSSRFAPAEPRGARFAAEA